MAVFYFDDTRFDALAPIEERINALLYGGWFVKNYTSDTCDLVKDSYTASLTAESTTFGIPMDLVLVDSNDTRNIRNIDYFTSVSNHCDLFNKYRYVDTDDCVISVYECNSDSVIFVNIISILLKLEMNNAVKFPGGIVRLNSYPPACSQFAYANGTYTLDSVIDIRVDNDRKVSGIVVRDIESCKVDYINAAGELLLSQLIEDYKRVTYFDTSHMVRVMDSHDNVATYMLDYKDACKMRVKEFSLLSLREEG